MREHVAEPVERTPFARRGPGDETPTIGGLPASPAAGLPARPDESSWTRLLGLELGGYLISKLLGQGGMGAVFLSTHLNLGRRAALKVLRPALSRDERLIARFRREARALARLESPYIVPIYDMFVADHLFCIAMRYAEHGSLRDLLKQSGPMEEAQAARLIGQAALGLAAAAEEGIVHRDVKPGNLLLTSEDRVQIADFGLVKVTSGAPQLDLSADLPAPGLPARPDAEGSLTDYGSFIGTPAYMSPEQFADSRRADHRSDLYGLGCTLYEMLTGQLPYEGPTAINFCNQHGLNDVPDPRALRSDLAPALVEAVTRLLQKDPAKRFPNGRKLARHLRSFAGNLDPGLTGLRSSSSNEVTGSRPLIHTPVPVSTPRRRRPVGLILGLLGVGLLGLGLAWQAGSTPGPVSAESLWWSPAPVQRAGDSLDAGLTWRNSCAMLFVRIPAGSFAMGSPQEEEGRQADETLHTERLEAPLWLAARELRRDEWDAVMGTDSAGEPSHPIAGISWYEAVTFCNRLSAIEGLEPAYAIDGENVLPIPGARGYRLPTEIEWERACRAGTGTPWSAAARLSPEVARFAARGPLPVGSLEPNAFGLYDMHGNVWEWTDTAYWDYATRQLADPYGGGHLLPVSRGGGWASSAAECRAAMRGFCGAGYRDPTLGMRLARSF